MRSRIKRVIIISTSLLAAGCAYAVLFSKTGIGIPCIFRKITGLMCPGCGTTRMLVSLLKLDFVSAWSYNPVVLCMLPVGAVLFALGLKRYIADGVNRMTKYETFTEYIMIAVLVGFGIVRNII